jgi:D-alanine-D-alanine ligase
MNSFGKVGVLMGGRSAERKISILSGTGILEALRGRGVDAHPFDPATRGLAELEAQGYDRVFIALHGRHGEDGVIQGALELLGIPYTGSGVMASSIAMDKITTKKIWLQHGLPTPGYASVPPGGDLDTLVAELGLPLIAKPPHEGSTIGIGKAETVAELRAAVDAAARYDDEVLVEQFVDGRELTVAILGRGKEARALPILEIVAPGGFYNYQDKYFTDAARYHCPAPLDAALAADIQRIALDAYHAIGCEGWARIDLMLRTEDMRPFLIEANTAPGMTGHSLVPMAGRAAGMDYADMCVAILGTARLKGGSPAPSRSA